MKRLIHNAKIPRLGKIMRLLTGRLHCHGARLVAILPQF